jgi:hypothetical protein
VWLAALTLTCLVLALLVLKTTGLGALIEHDLGRAAAWAPQDTRVDLATASLRFHQQEGEASPESLAIAMRAAPDAPAAVEPVLIAGAVFAAAGDKRRAEALFIEARLRDPRSPLARVHLLQLYAASGRIIEAAQELVVLANLIRARSSDVFIPQLAFYADDVAHRGAYGRLLAAHPNIRRELLLHLASNGEDPDRLIELAAQSVPTQKSPEDDAWQMPLVDRLVRDGDLSRAHRLWLRFTQAGPGRSRELIYDGSFTNPPRPGPFGWQLSETGGGAAELSGSSGLSVSYFGRERADLARQIVLLAPGRYRLQAKVSRQYREGPSALGWHVTCLENGSELLNLPLGLVSSSPSQVGADFTVPKGCAGQTLSLSGVPLEFAKAEDLRVHQVQIRPRS